MFYKSTATIALVLLGACANQPTKASDATSGKAKPVRGSKIEQMMTGQMATRLDADQTPTIREAPTISATSPNAPKGTTAMYQVRVPSGVDRGRLETVAAKALMERGYTPRIGNTSDLFLEVVIDSSNAEMGVTVVLKSQREGELFWTANRGMRFTGDMSSMHMPSPIPQSPEARAWMEGKTDRAVELLTSVLRELPRQTDKAK